MIKKDDRYDKHRFSVDLVEAREYRGYNRSQFADLINLSDNAVKNWETCVSFPKPDKWNDIKDAVGVNPKNYKKEVDTTTPSGLPLAETESDYSQYSSLQQKPYEEYTAVPKYKAKLS